MRRAGSKRFAALFTLALSMGAVGPAIGGLLAEQRGYGSVAWFEVSLIALSAALLCLGFVMPRMIGDPSPEATNAAQRSEPA